MIVLIFILCCWGLTHILVQGKIFDNARNWLIVKSSFLEGILTCHQCCGFWVGMVLYFIFPGLPLIFFHPGDFLLWGFISSGSCSLIRSTL